MRGTFLGPQLRRAEREESRRVAELMDIAGHGLPAYLWSLSAEGREPLDVGAERAASESGNFSYRNAVVAEENGEAVAMLLAYRLPDSPESADLDEIPELVRPLVELELLAPGTFYVNGLATLPGYRGRGLGSKLLEAANDLAAEAGCDELSIEVFEQNEGAVRLYESHGYRTVARRPAVPHPSYPYDGDVLLMTRKVARS
jgi:ribosomal protein S18 acetylase RimI-like enzyme